jgi:hypothetical protein
MGEIDNMLLALCFRRIANAAKSYLVVQAKWREITTFGFLMQKSQDLHQARSCENHGIA